MNTRQKRIKKRSQIHNYAVIAAILAGLSFTVMILWVANSALHQIEVRGCYNSTPDQFISLHCSEVIK